MRPRRKIGRAGHRLTPLSVLAALAWSFGPRVATAGPQRVEPRVAVTSAGWRHTLHAAGLAPPTGRVQIEAVHAAPPLTFAQFQLGVSILNAHPGLAAVGALVGRPALAEIAQFANAQGTAAGEPASTTAFLNYLTYRRSLDPIRFDHYHRVIGPLVGAEQTLAAGNCIPFNGLVPTNAYYNYLRFRRSLDPARFDHYHRNLGALLAEDSRVRALLAACATNPNPPPAGEGGGSGGSNGGGSSGPPPPPTVSPPAAPEPASVVIFVIAGVLLVGPRLARRRRRPASFAEA